MIEYARTAVGFLLGGLAMFLIVGGAEFLSARIFLPAEVKITDPLAVHAAFDSLPPATQNMAMGVVLLGWALGTLVAAYVTVYICLEYPYVHGAVMGLLCLIACGYELWTASTPPWALVVGLALPLPIAILAAWLVGS